MSCFVLRCCCACAAVHVDVRVFKVPVVEHADGMPAVRPLRFIVANCGLWGLGGGSRDPCALKTLWVYCREQPGGMLPFIGLFGFKV